MAKLKYILPLLLILVGTAHAATLVQSNTCTWTSGPTFNCNFSSPTTAGNTLIAIFGGQNTGGTSGFLGSVTDAAGNVWNGVNGGFGNSNHLRTDSAETSPAASVSSVVIHISGTVTSASGIIMEFSGMQGVGVDISTSNNQATSTLLATQISAAPFSPYVNQHELLFGEFVQNSSGTLSAPVSAGGTSSFTGSWSLVNSGVVSGGMLNGSSYSDAVLNGSPLIGAQVTSSANNAYAATLFGLTYSLPPQNVCMQGQNCDATTTNVVRGGITDLGYVKSSKQTCPGTTSVCKVALGDDAVLIDAAAPSFSGAIQGSTSNVQYLTIEEIQAGNQFCLSSGNPWSCCTGQQTTTTGTQTLPVSTLNVASTSGFTSSGQLVVNGNALVTYTGTGGGNSFTTASGGFGTIQAGSTVYQYNGGACSTGASAHGWWSPPTTNISSSYCTAAGVPWDCCTGSHTSTCFTGSWSPIFEFLGTGFGSAIGAQPPVPTISTGNKEDFLFRWDPQVRVGYSKGSWVFVSRTLNQPYGLSCQGGGVSKGNHPGNAGSVTDFALPANTYTAILADNGGFFGGTTAGPGGVNVFTNHVIDTIQVHNGNPIGGWVTFECTCGANQDSLCPPPDPIWVPPSGTIAWAAGTEFGNQNANINFGSQTCGANPTLAMTATWNATFNCPIPSN